MFPLYALPLGSFALYGLLGCIPTEKDPDIIPIDTKTTETTAYAPGPDLVVTDENVHTIQSEWTFAATQTATGANLVLGWEGTETDAYNTAHEASTFGRAVLLRIGTDSEDLEQRLAIDDLDAVIVDRWETDANGLTDMRTDDFAGFDPAVLVEDASQTWLFALGDLEGERLELLVGLVLRPTDTQGGTLITVPNGSAEVEWEGRIEGDELRTSGGRDDYTVDWSAVTVDGYGKPYNPALATDLFVGRYDDVYESDDLGGRLLDLGATAAGWWTTEVQGRSNAPLSELQGDDGPFPGFESGRVYLVGVSCGTCLGAAPLWVSGVFVR